MTLGRCPYYAYHVEADGNGQFDPSHSEVNLLAYCTHPHSPVTASAALFSGKGAGLLKCGGDLAKCQVPQEFRLQL